MSLVRSIETVIAKCNDEEIKRQLSAYKNRLRLRHFPSELPEGIINDFLAGEVQLGENKQIRKIIGEVICDFYQVRKEDIQAEEKKNSIKSCCFFSSIKTTDQTYIIAMCNQLKSQLEKEKIRQHEKLQAEIKQHLEKPEEKIENLRSRIVAINPDYSVALKLVEDGHLIEQLLEDLRNNAITNVMPIITAIADDYKARLIQKNLQPGNASENVIADIAQRVEDLTLRLKKPYRRDFFVEECAKDIMDADIHQPTSDKKIIAMGIRF